MKVPVLKLEEFVWFVPLSPSLLVWTLLMDEGPQWYPLNLHKHFFFFPIRIINLSSSLETQENENIFFSFFLAEETSAAISVWPQAAFFPAVA